MAADHFLAGSRPALRVRFREAARRHFVVITALLRREALVRIHSPLGSLLALGEPLFLIIAITFAVSVLDRRPPYGPSVALFLSTGFFPYYVFLYISNRMGAAVESPRLRFGPEQALDYIVVYILLKIIESTILAGVLFGGLFMFVTPLAMPHDILSVLAACAAMIMIGFGVGVANIVIRKLVPFWRYVYPPLVRLAMIFTGVLYIPDFLSPGARDILWYNPLVHAICLFRAGIYPHYPSLILDTQYLAFCSVLAVFFGFLIERNFRRALEQ